MFYRKKQTILMTFLKNFGIRNNKPHFKTGDRVRLNFGLAHSHLVKKLGSKTYKVQSVEWTDNLSYCDQFIEIDGEKYYNTIFLKC